MRNYTSVRAREREGGSELFVSIHPSQRLINVCRQAKRITVLSLFIYWITNCMSSVCVCVCVCVYSFSYYRIFNVHLFCVCSVIFPFFSSLCVSALVFPLQTRERRNSTLMGKWGDVLFFFLVKKKSMKRPKPTMNASTNKYFVCIKSWYIFFLCATEHCCPKMIKYSVCNTSVSHTVALGWPSSPWTHTHCSLFWHSPTYTVLLPQILTRAPKVDSSAAETSPQQMHYFLLFE